jgi:flagellin-like hook-associated protein FlgL
MAQSTIFDFEGAAPTFEDFNGSVSTIITNPDMSEPNTSDSVIQNVIPIAQGFAGIKITQPIDLAAGKTFTLQVWSPIENAPVLLKFEGSATSGDIERAVNFTGAANSWQELTFGFESEGDNAFDFVVVFMNFNINTNAAPITFYWDNLVQIDVPAPDGDQMDLPVTFDDADVNYGIVGFEGAEAAIVAGPVDAANQVGQVTKGTESGTSAGATVTSLPGGPAGFASPIPFTATATTMSVRVWSPTANIPVRLKVEKSDDVTVTVETEAMVTVAAAWDTLVFDFAQEITGTAALNLSSVYNKASLFFDFGSVPAETTNYFFDDMTFGGGGGVLPVALPVDFESTELTYDFGGFEGADSAIETNPDQTGENTSATVMRTIKTDGAQFFAGTFLNLDEPIDFSVNKGISIQSWSPKVGIPVRIRLEDAGNTAGIEVDVTTTAASGWETLTFDFTNQINPAVNYVRVVVFFEFVADLPGDGTTYYYDNIEVVEAGDGTPGVALPVDFESTELTYVFEGFEGADSAIETNPDQTGENTSATVMRTIKTDGAQFFAGTFLNLDEPIDFSVNKGISIQSWSPKAGIPVRIRLEDAGNTAGIEVDVTTTAASGWETLTADFTNLVNPSINYVRVIIFYEFVVDLPGDGTTYYYDNIEVAEITDDSPPVVLPVGFENTTSTYDFAGFEGADSAIETNPDQTGDNTSSTVMRTTKTDGAQFFAGTFLNLDAPIDLSNTGKIVFSSWSPKANIPVRIRLEDAGNTDGTGIEVDVNTVTSSTWETLEADFSALQNPNVDYVRIVIFYEFIVDLPGDNTTYYFDNLSVDALTSTRRLTAEEVQVSPNPTADLWQITSPEARIEALELFDLSGRLVFNTKPNTNTYEIDARQLPTGTYIVRITTAEGRRVARLMKQ